MNRARDIFVNHAGLSLLLQRLEMEPSPVAGKKWPKSRTIPLDKICFGGRKFMANQLGRRYQCSVCDTVVLCTKASEGIVQCHDKEMEVQQPRRLPSSD